MIPGSNLLTMALSVIAKQSFTYAAFVSRTLNANGIWTPSYATPVTVQGSAQPVPRELFDKYGLDFQKSYYVFYVPQSVIDVTRNVAGDQFVYLGMTFNAESKTDWFGVDGWVGVIAARVSNAG